MARAQRSAAVRFSYQLGDALLSVSAGGPLLDCSEWLGWEEHAKQAAKEWGLGVKWKPGTYESWYQLTL